jgi:hypothetical protein
MQLGSIYLYPNRLDVYTNLESWVHERYRRVYNRNLKVYRGVDNRVEFRVKNSDQKPANISSRTFVFRLIVRETQELLIKKDCELVDAINGRIVLNLSENELLDIEPALYQYSLSYEVREDRGDYYVVTDKKPVYVDTQYGANAVIEVLGGVDGEPLPSVEISEFKRYVDPIPENNFFHSGIIDANAPIVTANSLHTFQLYFTNFTGRVTLQASLSKGGDPQTWADIASYDYIDTNREYINIVGKYSWFRFKYETNFNQLLGDFTVTQTIFGHYNVTLNTPGKNYDVGHQIVIKGDKLGGEKPTHDLLITITRVDANGEITEFTHTGLSYNGVRQYVIGPSTTIAGTFDKFLYR